MASSKITQASCFTDSIPEFEDSSLTERVYLGKSVLPRYCTIHEIVAVLTLEGCPVNYQLINIILISLPCLCKPNDFFNELVNRYKCNETLNDLSPPTVEQIHLKILVILRCWARSTSSHSDFTGLLIENIIDFVSNVIENNTFPSVVAAAKKVRSNLKIVRDDLKDFNIAILTYCQRSDSLGLFPQTTRSSSPKDHSNSIDVKQSIESINISSLPVGYDDSDHNRNHSSSIDMLASRGSLESVSLMELRESNSAAILMLQTEDYNDSNISNGSTVDIKVDKKLIFEDHFSRPKPSLSIPLIEETYKRSSSLPVMITTNYSTLADMLTIIEYEYFLQSLRPREFINKGWTKSESRNKHPDIGGSMHLTNLNLWTNQMIAWIATEILDFTYQHGSAMTALEYFIRVARSTIKLNNFNTAFQIIMALGLPAIQRLKTGWSQVSRKKQDLYKSYIDIFESKNNFSNYRKRLHSLSVNEPRVPCIQVVLKDIYMLETSSPWRVGGKMDLRKASSLYAILSEYIRVDDTDPVNYSVRIIQYNANLDNKSDSTEISPSNSFTLYNSQNHSNSFTISSPKSSTSNYNNQYVTMSPKSTNNTALSPKSPQPKALLKTLSFKTSIDNANINDNTSNKLSFLNNCKLVRESIFQSLHDNVNKHKQQQLQQQQQQQQQLQSSIQQQTDQIDTSYDILLKENVDSISGAVSPKKYQPVSRTTSTISSSLTRTGSNNNIDINASHRLSSNSSSGSMTNSRRHSGTSSMFSGILHAISRNHSNNKNSFELIGNDEEIGKLLYRVIRIDADLKKLWDYSEAADIAEINRLMGKLTRSGLY